MSRRIILPRISFSQFKPYPLRYFAISLILISICLYSVSRVKAAGTSTWPVLSIKPYANGFVNPVVIANAGDGTNRLFVVEQRGRILIIQSGSIVATPFLDISSRVLSGGERGLLGLAFPPGYSGKGYFYVYYTMLDGNNVVSRFHLTQNPGQADPNSEERILFLLHPTYPNHNGGELAFDSQGYLYIGTGDGGGAGDPFGNAQNLGSLLGKILRIDVENIQPAPKGNPVFASPSQSGHKYFLPFIGQKAPLKYNIPSTNPFVTIPYARAEVFAYGLRNPWRFSFDPANGNLYIADVGQNSYEEIDVIPAQTSGQNFGWNIMEGMHCYNSTSCNTAGLTLPIAEYFHGTNDSIGCAVIGGFVYRGSNFPSMQGIYFYGDYCTGRIWGLKTINGQVQTKELTQEPFLLTTFGVDEGGKLYLASSNGTVYEITAP